jgi:hypothetical protein
LVRLISTRFVPVAVDQHVHRHLKDAEGETFAKVLKQARRGLDGYSQGVYLFTPQGHLLAFANTSDAVHVRRLVDAALKQFDPAAETAKGAEARAAPVFPKPPDGGLVVDVTAKILDGYGPSQKALADRYEHSLGRDYLWVRKDEAEAVARGVVPDSLARRIARFHLVDNTRGEPPMWRSDEVKAIDVTLRGGQLTGSVWLETRAGDRGYRADLRGVVEVKDGRVVRFDLVVRGEFWGEGAFTRGAPKGKFPLAVAFTLSDGTAGADRVPPQAARGGGLRGYLQ